MNQVSEKKSPGSESSTDLLQATPVLLSVLGWYRFIWERHSGKLVLIIMISDVLDVFEDWVQVLHPLSIEKTNLADESLQK